MELHSTRSAESLREVMLNPNATGPKDAYWVFNKVTNDKWENMTIITTGRYDIEYPKTYGHYHTASHETEIYKLISGTGLFLLQKKHLDNNNNFVVDTVDEVIIVKADVPGEEISIPDGYAHSWSNVGDIPLITMDNWKWNHRDTDYEPIRAMKGMAFYITDNKGEIELIPNTNYRNHPKPTWVTVKEFNQRFSNSGKISSII